MAARGDMTDLEEDTVGQQGGSPSRRGVDQEGRTERRRSSPFDPETTRDGDENEIVVERGRVRDVEVRGVDDDDEQRLSPVQHDLCSSPSRQRRLAASSGTTAAPRIRSTVSRPVKLQPTGGHRGAGVMQLCRPRDADAGAVAAAADENPTINNYRLFTNKCIVTWGRIYVCDWLRQSYDFATRKIL